MFFGNVAFNFVELFSSSNLELAWLPWILFFGILNSLVLAFSYRDLIKKKHGFSYELLSFHYQKRLLSILHTSIYMVFLLYVPLYVPLMCYLSKTFFRIPYIHMAYDIIIFSPFVIMSSKVICEMSFSCKCLATWFIITLVRFLSCVDSEVSLQVAFCGERLMTAFVFTFK